MRDPGASVGRREPPCVGRGGGGGGAAVGRGGGGGGSDLNMGKGLLVVSGACSTVING